MITGEISDENHVLADGKIVLSRNAAEKLINEIKRSFELDK